MIEATTPTNPVSNPTPGALSRANKSTNVRSYADRVRMLRAGFRVLDRVSPGLAIAAARHLFLSPRRYRRPDWERDLLDRAEALTLRVGERRVAAWAWGQGDPIVLVHGWEGRGAQLGHLVEPLVRAGHRVITYDAPAHGETGGRQTTLPEFADCLWAVARREGPLAGVVAHSMGAAAAALAVHEGLPVRRVAFVAPPADMAEVTRRFAGFIGMGEAGLGRFKDALADRILVRVDTLNARRFARNCRLPVLVVHDREDAVMPFEDGEGVATAFGGALMSTQGLGHRRILRDPAVVARIAGFVAT